MNSQTTTGTTTASPLTADPTADSDRPEEASRIGQQVVVCYDPNDPTTNALTDFADLELSSLGMVPWLLFGIGSVAALIFWKRRQHSKAAER